MQDEEALYLRIRVLLSRAWGVAPPVLERMFADGEVGVTEVFEALMLELADPVRGGVIEHWLLRESKAAAAAKVEKLRGLELLLRATVDEGKRSEIAAMMERVAAE